MTTYNNHIVRAAMLIQYNNEIVYHITYIIYLQANSGINKYCMLQR